MNRLEVVSFPQCPGPASCFYKRFFFVSRERKNGMHLVATVSMRCESGLKGIRIKTCDKRDWDSKPCQYAASRNELLHDNMSGFLLRF